MRVCVPLLGVLAACGGSKAAPAPGVDAGGEVVAASGSGGGAPKKKAAPCVKADAVDAAWTPAIDRPEAVLLDEHVVSTPLTRARWFEAAMKLRGAPIGDDPIRAMLTSLGATAPTFTIDLTRARDAGEKRVLIEAAARAGGVVVDGDAIWLGDDKVLRAGCDAMVIAAVDLERATTVDGYARRAGAELAGAAVERAAAPVVPPAPKACDDGQDAAIFFSPARPNSKQPLRVIATLEHDPGPVELVLVDPAGNRHAPAMIRLGGPPYSYVISVDTPATGKWTAVVGDGTRVDACLTTKVAARPTPRRGDPTHAWLGRKRWTQAVENFYSAWVQRLFDYPVDQDLTWPNLHTLLADQEHNLLFDHLSHDEDNRFKLEPDCADLPYTLRAYFAWKLDLPFGFLVCNRGGSGKPPKCKDAATIAAELAAEMPPEEVVEPPEESVFSLDPEPEPEPALPLEEEPKKRTGRLPGDNLMLREELTYKNEPALFQAFFRAMIRGVNSASGRTAPNDELTDWYPVPMTRDGIRPGTMYADPYGHLMVMVAWYPQQPGGYGILMGADAQPDATIGRRRFWRGNYLFTAETKRAGAGFKWYRNRVKKDGAVVAWDNAKLAKAGWWTRFSSQQYDGSTDDFYDRMEELINPRPLDALQMQVSLVDALEEAVVRRVNSVENGEVWKRTNSETIPMPEGAAIFLTSGPWEDFSTPSRDHRILVAIDTVLGLAAAVERRPERYRLDKADVPAMLETLEKNLEKLLAERKFEYPRTDGSKWTLTLADVVARAERWEVAYNPNDCPEYRWGAPEGSAEASTCTRRAPAAQQARMEQYRPWFAKRERPVE